MRRGIIGTKFQEDGEARRERCKRLSSSKVISKAYRHEGNGPCPVSAAAMSLKDNM